MWLCCWLLGCCFLKAAKASCAVLHCSPAAKSKAAEVNSEEDMFVMYRAMNFQGAMPVPHLCLMPCSLQVPGCSFQSGHCAQRARPLAENRKASWNPSCSICALCDGTRDGSISSNLLPHVRPLFEKCFVVFLHISFISQRFLLRFSFLFLSESLSISILLSHSPR